MFDDDDPNPYDVDRHYHRRDVYRRRSSPSLIDDDRAYGRERRAQSNRTSQPSRYRGYDDDESQQARPTRINFDDDEDLWQPQPHGQRTRARHMTDPAPPRKQPSWTSANRQRHPPYHLDDSDDDTRRWESAKARQAPQQRRHDDYDDYWEDTRSANSRPATHQRHRDVYDDLEAPRNTNRGDRRMTNHHQTPSHRRTFDNDSEPSHNAHSERQQAPVRRRHDDGRAPPKNTRTKTPERRSAPVHTQPSPVRNRYDDSEAAAESDALSIFAHIRTESDSGSSGNRENFDDDQDDDIENARTPTPVRPAPKSKPKKQPAKPKKAPKPQAPPEDSESSFTMGSNQESVEIPAIPPPGAQVAATDATAIAAMLWTVDHLDRFSLGLTVVLSVLVVSALITAMAAHEPQLFVVVGVYAILWFLIHRESRALQEQMRSAHDCHAAMNAAELAEVNVVVVARRTIETTASKLMRIVQVSACGSVVFLVLSAGLAMWSGAWASFGLAAVIIMVSGAAAAMATIQYRTIINTTDAIMSEGIT